MFLKRQLPLLITAIAALVMIFAYFIPHPVVSGLRDSAQSWYLVVAAFTMILGILNLLIVSINRATKGAKKDRFYHWVTVVSLLGTIFFGFLKGGMDNSGFDFIFKYIYTPLSATLFSLLAFYVASASFRAFRAKSTMATILLLTAFIVMLGQVPLGQMLTGNIIPDATNWIMNVMNMAGQRAVLIGAALGIIATSIKIILGIERSYLGGE